MKGLLYRQGMGALYSVLKKGLVILLRTHLFSVLAKVRSIPTPFYSSVWPNFALFPDIFLNRKPAMLRLALVLLRRLRCGGLLFLAPVCSSFTFLNMPTSGRCFLLPDGLPTEKVCAANLLAARCAVLFRLAGVFNAVAALEQPVQRSCGGGLVRLPVWQDRVSEVATYRRHVCQGQYGAPTVKPTWLYSNHTCFDALHAGLPDAVQMARMKTSESLNVVRKRQRVSRLHV